MKNRLSVARHIARQQTVLDPGVDAVYYVRSGKSGRAGGGPIVLVQVSRAAVPAGVVPIGFPPEPKAGIDYPYVIIDLTPTEFEKVKKASDRAKAWGGWRAGWRIGAPLTAKAKAAKLSNAAAFRQRGQVRVSH